MKFKYCLKQVHRWHDIMKAEKSGFLPLFEHINVQILIFMKPI